ncbi:hypothetical protein [Vampirovibrio chlorellavorus]|uniref:hypothetical protein n=1 Tax=Vampirovibrio chlorellavorus TaxID=758823 RepID=UPI0026EF7258|nr:hypothetical protein [Vampirovibrio chlorellavorus]
MTLTGPSLYPYPNAPRFTAPLPQRPSYPSFNQPFPATGFSAPATLSTAMTPGLASGVTSGLTTGRSQWPASFNAAGFNASGLPAAMALPGSVGFQPTAAFSPASAPSRVNASPFAISAPETPGLASAWSNLTDNSQPLTADAMGQKVGTVVASFMKENPALLEKLNGVDLDALAQDIGPKVEKARAQIQQALKKMPQAVDNRLIRMLDPGTRELATEFDQWLRKEPDPALLANMAREERLKARQENAKTQRQGANAGTLADPFAADDPFGDAFLPEKPATWKDKILNTKDQLWAKMQSSWPLNRRQKPDNGGLPLEEAFASLRNKPKPPISLDGALSEAELDALLGSGLTFKANPKK